MPLSFKRAGFVVASVALAACVVRANVETDPAASADGNPYTTIVDRNPFGLKPPPPPPPPPEQTAPPVPMAQVTLTGLLSTFGEPRVLLEIIEDVKTAGQPQRPPPLREGERHGTVEVLSIDVVKNSVRLRNAGVETNVSFPIAKAGPVPGAPGVPGVPGAPPRFTPPALGVPPQQPQASAPTVISPNNPNANAGGGVTLMGGTDTTPTATASATGVPSPLGGASGMRTIPSRPLRTENSAGLPPMTKEQADLLMEMNRLRGGPPTPPTSLTPIIEGMQQEGQPQQQPQNPAFPRLPYRGGPPPVPGR